MNRRDYELVARTINALKASGYISPAKLTEFFVVAFDADHYSQRFDARRFRLACDGVQMQQGLSVVQADELKEFQS